MTNLVCPSLHLVSIPTTTDHRYSDITTTIITHVVFKTRGPLAFQAT